MEVVVPTGATRCAKLQSNHHHQQTNTQLFTGWTPFLSPNQQCLSTEGKQSLQVITIVINTHTHVQSLLNWPICFNGYHGYDRSHTHRKTFRDYRNIFSQDRCLPMSSLQCFDTLVGQQKGHAVGLLVVTF